MALSWELAELDIVGYADVRTAHMLPAIMPALYGIRSTPDTVLLPPYSLSWGAVTGAIVATRGEAERLRDRREIFLLEDPIPARADHTLWLRRDGELIYQPRHEAQRMLRELGLEALARAVTALRDGEMEEAEEAAGEAILADDRRWEGLAVKVAIRRREGNLGGEKLMRRLAALLVGSWEFSALVDDYQRIISRSEAGPMSNMALKAA